MDNGKKTVSEQGSIRSIVDSKSEKVKSNNHKYSGYGKRVRTAYELVHGLVGDSDIVVKASLDLVLEYFTKTYKEKCAAKFNESIEAAFKLNVDPRQSDQIVRGAVVMPRGVGKISTVVVLTSDSRMQEAMDAGADFAGFEDIVEKIRSGTLVFDLCMATPDIMPKMAADIRKKKKKKKKKK